MHLSNYHSHCYFCDGKSLPETFVRFAVSRKFQTYGFSSHSPLPFDTNWNMPKDLVDDYFAEINRLKRKYAGKITLYAGMEIDYLDKSYNASIPYFQEMPLDYRISSVHFLPKSEELSEKNMISIDGSFNDFQISLNNFFGGDIREMVTRYYQSVKEMIEAGGFDIVGHIDKIYMYSQLCDNFYFSARWYQDLVHEVFELIAQKGMIVEVNTKNLIKKGEIYPHFFMLPILRKLKIPIMINSDCHYPDLIDSGIKETVDILKKEGICTARELINGVWEEVSLY